MNRFNTEGSTLLLVGGASGTLLRDYGLAGWIEAKVGLSHQLLVKRGINTAGVPVEVLGGVANKLDISTASRVGSIGGTSTTSFEKFGEDGLLLLVHVPVTLTAIRMDAESFALDRVVELPLPLLCSCVLGAMVTTTAVLCRIITGRMASLHRL